MAEPRLCAYCVEPFTPQRSTRRTCSDACRQADSRRRRGLLPTSGKRRRRASRERREATGRAEVREHKPIPAAVARFRPTDDGAGFILEGADRRRWCLVDLGHRGPGTGGGPWLLLERVPGAFIRDGRGAVRRLFDAAAELEGPSSATTRAALVWAALRVHAQTPRGYHLARALEDQARDLERRASSCSAELAPHLVAAALELSAEGLAVRRAADAAWLERFHADEAAARASSSTATGTDVP